LTTRGTREQLVERAISTGEVELVVSNCQLRWPDPGGNLCYVRLVGARWLRVVIAAESDPPRVVTAMIVKNRPRGAQP
jgi:hypothetical protein